MIQADQSPQSKFKLNFSSFVSEKNCSYADDYKLGVRFLFYNPKGVLGVGAFSQVRKVTHRKTKTVRAMKVVSKNRLSSAE